MKRIYTVFIFCITCLFFFQGCSSDKENKKNAQPTCLEDISDCTVAVMTGSTQEMFLSYNYPEIKVLQLANISDVLAAVQNGVADYTFMDSVYLLDLPSGINDVEYQFSAGKGGDFGVAFNKKDVQLCQQFNQFLAEIRANGTYKQINDRWLTGKAESSPMPKQANTSNNAVLKVGISPNFPFTFIRNDEWCGLECELIILFGDYINREIEYEVYDFNALIPALCTGKIDATLSCITITDERKKEMLFSDPYYHCADVIVGIKAASAGNQAKTSFLQKTKDGFHNNLIVEDRWKMLVDGLWETLIISIFSILLGTIIGGVICWLSMSRFKILNIIAKIYIEILRDVPILVFLMIMFYVVFAHSSISATSVAIIAFALNFGAFVSVMYKTGIEGVDIGQREAGLALGFSKTGTFINFIVPQAMRSIVPVFKNEAVSLVKNTSIVGYIAIQDLTKVSDIIRSRTFDAFFPLIIISIIYFILAWLLGKGLDLLVKEKKN